MKQDMLIKQLFEGKPLIFIRKEAYLPPAKVICGRKTSTIKMCGDHPVALANRVESSSRGCDIDDHRLQVH